MPDNVHRASREFTAVCADHGSDSDGLSSIVLQGGKVQGIPWSKSPPVFDPNGCLAASFAQTSGNAVIHAAATFDTRQDQNQSARLTLRRVQSAVKAGCSTPQWSQSETDN
jgi:hypothetical protein